MAVAGLAMWMAGCGEKPAEIPVADLAATVNGEAILRKQVAESPVLAGARDAAAPLDRLVDTTLLVQAAKAKGLDKDPDVQRRLEAASRQALAAAYLERVAEEDTARPGIVQVEQYFDENPLLFSQRRIYTYRELRIELPSADMGRLRRDIEAARSAAEVDRLLGPRRAAAVERQVQEPAERVPLLALRQLAELTPGRSLVLLENPQGQKEGLERARIVTLVTSKPSPMNLDAAQASILAHLRAKQRSEAIALRLAELRSSAKIERFPLERRADAASGTSLPAR